MPVQFTDKILRKASHHLLYEYQMLESTFALLTSGSLSRALQNVALESFVLHFRVLTDFYYGRRKGVDNLMADRYPRDHDVKPSLPDSEGLPSKRFWLRHNDIGAVDYFRTKSESRWDADVPNMPNHLFIDWVRANKQVAHLCKERLRQFPMRAPERDHQDKIWYFGDIYGHLEHVHESFLVRVDAKLIHVGD